MTREDRGPFAALVVVGLVFLPMFVYLARIWWVSLKDAIWGPL